MGRVTFFRVTRVEKAEGDEGPGASNWGADMIYTRRGSHSQHGRWRPAACPAHHVNHDLDHNKYELILAVHLRPGI